eukprot:CAMPEP_0115888258 /NCGR_PEP_ID=MMETSP0287-20121206/32212_1 /TAXON_ID=412157 /ORGANISM="Chrysochromulina rotalis, Strain UIO044" /LENGTH=79 /DNA_ID=CAMNT_0003344931 /DNA_START=375 /DNA_END=614 /DNA_ORIENTATION=+
MPAAASAAVLLLAAVRRPLPDGQPGQPSLSEQAPPCRRGSRCRQSEARTLGRLLHPQHKRLSVVANVVVWNRAPVEDAA